jgi:hypothetical protein
MPYLISVPYVAIVLATSYELTFDVLRASSLTRDLQESRSALRESDLRLALAADAARLRFWSWDADADEIWTVPGEGLPRGDVMDERIDLRRFFSAVHPEDRSGIWRTIRGSGRKGGRLRAGVSSCSSGRRHSMDHPSRLGRHRREDGGGPCPGSLDRRDSKEGGRGRGAEAAGGAGASLPGDDAGRAVRLARPRVEPAADGDPLQRAGRPAVSRRRGRKTSRRCARSSTTSSGKTSGPER